MVTLIACLIPISANASFLDTADHLHEYHIDELNRLGIVEGYGYGIFRPDIPINRAEFLKILMLAVFGEEALEVENDRCFGDFVGQSQWFWKYACIAKERGIIQGYPDGTFRGWQTVNLAEALKIAIEGWGLPVSDVEYEYWYIPYFEVAAEHGLFKYFLQNGAYLLTRSDMAYLIVSMGEPIQDVSGPEKLEEDEEDQGILDITVIPVCGNGIREVGEQCDDGNTLDGDGCSSLCIVVSEPVYHGALSIEQRPISATSVSEGMDNVTLLEFDAVSGRQNTAITDLSFRSENGSLDSATNYRILMDSDGDSIADTLVRSAASDGETVSFDELNIVVPMGVSVRVELQADISISAQSGDFSVEFDLDNPLFVQGVGLADGRDLTGIELNGAECTEVSICWIAVSTISNPSFSILGRGNLYVYADSMPVRSRQILGGKTTEDLLRLAFRADGEDMEMGMIKISADQDVFSRLLLYKEGSSFPADTAYTTECSPVATDKFCADDSILIEENEDETYIIRGVVKMDSEGGVSGDTTSASLIADPSKLIVEAVGEGSQEDLELNDGDSTAEGEVFIGRNSVGADQDITGPTNDVVMAKIENIENANSDSDGTAVPTGTNPFGIFRFTAAEHDNLSDGRNKVTIQTLVFTVNATNVEFLTDSFKLYNTLNASITSDCIATAYTGNITVTCSGLDSASVDTEIDSGEYADLALQGFISNAQVSPGSASTLQAALQSLGDRTNPGTVEWDDEVTTFGWVDLDTTVVQSTTYSK